MTNLSHRSPVFISLFFLPYSPRRMSLPRQLQVKEGHYDNLPSEEEMSDLLAQLPLISSSPLMPRSGCHHYPSPPPQQDDDANLIPQQIFLFSFTPLPLSRMTLPLLPIHRTPSPSQAASQPGFLSHTHIHSLSTFGSCPPSPNNSPIGTSPFRLVINLLPY